MADGYVQGTAGVVPITVQNTGEVPGVVTVTFTYVRTE